VRIIQKRESIGGFLLNNLSQYASFHPPFPLSQWLIPPHRSTITKDNPWRKKDSIIELET